MKIWWENEEKWANFVNEHENKLTSMIMFKIKYQNKQIIIGRDGKLKWGRDNMSNYTKIIKWI